MSPRLGDEGTLFLRCDALHRRAVYGSAIKETYEPIRTVAEAEGCEFKWRSSIKAAPRLLVKTLEVIEELNGAPGDDDLFASASCWVLDWLACSVVCADASALRRVYEKLLSGAAGKMIRVKNTFIDEPLAYRDLKVWIAGLGGYRAGDTRPPLVIEVQLHLESFYAAQRARHVAYELERGDFDWWKHEHAVIEPKLKPAPAEPVPSAPVTERRLQPRRNPKRRKGGPGIPLMFGTVGIIIVPNAPTALLTLVNAADLLERNTFVTPAQKRQQGAKKEPVIKVSRTRGDGVVQSFKLVDDPRQLSNSDWKKVVAVVAQGAAWQFKGWKVSQPVDLFNKYLGVHFKYDDSETPKDVKKWNVSVVSVNKHKRHLDPTAAHSFWRLVDDHIARRKKEKAGAAPARRKK